MVVDSLGNIITGVKYWNAVCVSAIKLDVADMGRVLRVVVVLRHGG